jgi:phage/plasmid primase-like uncharacterized protein
MSDMIMDVKPRKDFATVKQMASGQWHSIIPAITGIDSKYLTSIHKDCPINGCGGKDRFKFDDKDGSGTWYCNAGHGGRNAGDGFSFLEHYLNVSSSEALHLVAEYLGLVDGNGLARKEVFRPVQPPELKQPKDDKASREEAIETTKYILDKCTESTTHPYLKAKGLDNAGFTFLVSKEPYNQLIIKLYDLSNPDKLIGAQLISPELNERGKYPKRNVKGTPVSDAFHVIKGDETKYIAVVEGYATGLSVFLATGYTTIVAFGANKMIGKAERIQALYPDAELVFFADNEESRTGIKEASKASGLVAGKVALTPEVKDWNDFHLKYGLECTRGVIKAFLSQDTNVFNKGLKYGFIDLFTPIQVITKDDGIITAPMIEAIRNYQGYQCYCPISGNIITNERAFIQGFGIRSLRDGFVSYPTIGRIHDEAIYDKLKKIPRNKSRLATVGNDSELLAFFLLNIHEVGSTYISAKGFNNHVKKRQVKPIPELNLLINALVKAKINASVKYFSSNLDDHEHVIKLPMHDGKLSWDLAKKEAAKFTPDGKPIYKAIFVKASHGTGKTSCFMKGIFSLASENGNSFFTAHRAKLVSQACSVFNFFEYTDKEIQSRIGVLTDFGVCLHSLRRGDILAQLENSKCVGIDEASQLLASFNSDKNIPKEAKQNLINGSKKVMENGGQIYLLDADMTSKDIKKYQELLSISDNETLIIDAETPDRGYIAYINVKASYQSQRTAVVGQIMNDHLKGIKSVIACESEKTAEAIIRLLDKENPQIKPLLVTAKTVSKLENEKRKNSSSGFIAGISKEVKGYDCIVYTNVIGTGVSIEHDAPIFTKCYGIFSGNVLIQNDWVQMMRRFRNIKEFHFEITARPSYRRLNIPYKNTRKEAIQEHIKDDVIKSIEMDIQHETEQKRDLGVIGLIHHLKEHGFDVKGAYEELVDTLPIKEITEEDYENILSARIITGNEASEIKRKRSEGLSIDDQYALKRYEVSEYFGGEINLEYVKAYTSIDDKRRLDNYLTLTRKESFSESKEELSALIEAGIIELAENSRKSHITLGKEDKKTLHDKLLSQLPALIAYGPRPYGYVPESFNRYIKKADKKQNYCETTFIKNVLKEFGFEFEKSKSARNGKESERQLTIKVPELLYKRLNISSNTYGISPDKQTKEDIREAVLRLKGLGLGYEKIAKELNIKKRQVQFIVTGK